MHLIALLFIATSITSRQSLLIYGLSICYGNVNYMHANTISSYVTSPSDLAAYFSESCLNRITYIFCEKGFRFPTLCVRFILSGCYCCLKIYSFINCKIEYFKRNARNVICCGIQNRYCLITLVLKRCTIFFFR